VALLLGGACGIFLWEPWHGPVILSLSSRHGIDVGDLLALPLLALAIVIARHRFVKQPASARQPG